MSDSAPATTSGNVPHVPSARMGLSGIFMLVRRSLRQHALSSAVTMLSIALAAGLVMTVFSLQSQSRDAFLGGAGNFDAVVGARGSKLQLVLNNVFHLESSPGNIPWSIYETVLEEPGVDFAIPYAVGDSYMGARIVGTTTDLFDKFEYRPGRKLAVQTGRRLSDMTLGEAVVGAEAARRTGLRYGAMFQPTHGVTAAEATHVHEETYVVVGVLEPTGTPMDRVILIPLEGILRMSGHVLRTEEDDMYAAQPGQEIPDEVKQISAVMLRLRGPQAGLDLDERFNKRNSGATLAFPIGAVMADLFDQLGWMVQVLGLVAVLVVIVAASAVLASIHNTINERRREFAILRALGARRSTVFSIILLEAGLIAAIGAALGFIIYGAIMSTAAVIIRRQTGVVIEPWAFNAVLLWTPPGMVLLGLIAGLIPAAKAYATDVATHLAPQS